MLIRLVAGAVIALPLLLFPPPNPNVDVVEFVLSVAQLIIEPTIGYYVFKHVIEKHVLPNVLK